MIIYFKNLENSYENIVIIWNCIYKTNISSVKIFLHLSSYPEHFLYYPSSFPVILLPYKKAIPAESPQL